LSRLSRGREPRAADQKNILRLGKILEYAKGEDFGTLLVAKFYFHYSGPTTLSHFLGGDCRMLGSKTMMMALLFTAITVLAVAGLVLIARSLPHTANQEQNQSQPNGARAGSEPSVSGSNEKKHGEGTENQKPPNYWKRLVAYVEANEKFINATSTAFIAAFTIVLAGATGFLYRATTNLVTGTEQASARELRAYVFLQISARLYPPLNPNRWAVSLTVTNSGKTWARNMTIKTERLRRQPGDVRDPFNIAEWDKMIDVPTILGPGEVINLQFGDIPLADLPSLAKREAIVSYVVWVQYQDTVSTPPAMQQTQRSWLLNADTEGGISFSANPTHNCADDDCPK
jgi:hypothetical protein